MRDFSEYLEYLIIKFGSQTNLAVAAQMDAAKLSRFRSDQNGLIREEIDRLLQLGDAVIATRKEIEQYEDTLDHMAAMWRRERKGGKEKEV